MPKTNLNGLMQKFKRAARIKFDAKDMRIFADIVRSARLRAFDESRAPDGSKWAKLKPETIARKRKGKGASQEQVRDKRYKSRTVYRKQKSSSGAGTSATPEKPLIDKGYLRMPTIEAKTNEARVTIAKSREEIGPFHNKGGGNLPKREHWAIYPEALDKIEQMKEAIFARKIREIFD